MIMKLALVSALFASTAAFAPASPKAAYQNGYQTDASYTIDVEVDHPYSPTPVCVLSSDGIAM